MEHEFNPGIRNASGPVSIVAWMVLGFSIVSAFLVVVLGMFFYLLPF